MRSEAAAEKEFFRSEKRRAGREMNESDEEPERGESDEEDQEE